MSYTIEGGIIVGPSPNECAGYVFNFSDHGAYDPTGKIQVGDLELTQEQVDTHNRLLSDAEMQNMVQRGKGLFYLTYDAPPCTPQSPRWQQENNGTWYERNFRVSNWAGHFKAPWVYTRKFRASAYGGDIPAFSVWFTGPDGQKWFGTQKGYGQNFIARRLKRQN